MVSTVDTSFIRGIAKMDDRLITLLDLNKVLSLSESISIGKLSQ
jgi:hypothetical protein